MCSSRLLTQRHTCDNLSHINTYSCGYLQTQTRTPDTYVKTQTFKHTSVATAHTAWQTYKTLTQEVNSWPQAQWPKTIPPASMDAKPPYEILGSWVRVPTGIHFHPETLLRKIHAKLPLVIGKMQGFEVMVTCGPKTAGRAEDCCNSCLLASSTGPLHRVRRGHFLRSR